MTRARLRLRTWGSGPKRALLLHGSASSSATWWRVAPALGEAGWTVVAPDLPSHGTSPRSGAPLLPSAAAESVTEAVHGQRFDLLVGHSFGAAVAVELLAASPVMARAAVLEELPGQASVAWDLEADAVLAGAKAARGDLSAAYAETRERQPRWAEQDCRHTAQDLAACGAEDIAAGLRLGQSWTTADTLRRVRAPVVLLLAADAPGVNRVQDATALRGADRRESITALGARTQVVDAGHCIHRDDPAAWLRAVTAARAI